MTGWLLYIYGHDPADTWMTITGFMMICLILFGKREKGIMLGALVNGMACMFALALLPRFFSLPRKSEVSEGLQFMVDWFFSPVIFCFLSGVAWMIYRDSLKAEARADQLLLNVLPKRDQEQYHRSVRAPPSDKQYPARSYFPWAALIRPVLMP